MLFMCGLPGGYPDDLIDVDLDALEGPEADGVIRVSNADYLARPLRLTPTEATAIIVALRALRDGADDDTREVVDRALAKLEAAAAEGRPAALVDPGDDVGRRRSPRCGPASRTPSRRRPAGAAHLLRAGPRRGVRAGRRPARRGHRARRRLPRRLVPQRRGAAAVPARPDPRGRTCSTAPVETDARARRATCPTGCSQRRGDHAGHPARCSPQARWVVEYYPVEDGPARAPTAASRSTCWSPTSAGCSGCCCGWRRTPRVVSPAGARRGRSPRPRRQALSLYDSPAA